MFELEPTPILAKKKKPTGTTSLTKKEFLAKCSAKDRLYWQANQEQFKTLKFKKDETKRTTRQQEKNTPKVANRIAHCTLQPNAFHIYTLPEEGYQQSERFIENKVNLKMNKPKGELSDKARKRIENAIQWLLLKSNPKRVYNREQDKVMWFRLNFITVTLPSKQMHTDSEITEKCLGHFLNQLRAHGLKDYLWRAEVQPSTGNIHFHITTNKFFHYKDIRSWWNVSVNQLGYVDRFEAKFNHRNPPSTEIRKVKHIRKLAAYLSKYMAKEKSFAPVGELRKIGGKVVEMLYTDKAYKDEASNQKQGTVIGTILASETKIVDGRELIVPIELRKVDARLWACSQSISKCTGLRISQADVQWQVIQELSNHPEIKRIPGNYVDSYFGNVVKIAKAISAGFYEDLLDHSKGNSVSKQFTDDKLLQYL